MFSFQPFLTVLGVQYKKKDEVGCQTSEKTILKYRKLLLTSGFRPQTSLIQIIQFHFQVFQHTSVGTEKGDADSEYDQDKKE